MRNLARIILRIGLGLLLLLPTQNTEAQETKKERTKGYQGFLELGMTCFTEKTDEGSFNASASLVNGYLFSPCFFAGLGIGYDYYPEEPTAVVLPLYLDFRYYIRSLRIGRKGSPFINMKTGVMVVLVSDWISGALYNVPSVGIRWDLGKRISVNASVGYAIQGIDGVNIRVGLGF